MNGIIKIKPFDTGEITAGDLCLAMLKDLGCSISSMPTIKESIAYTSDWEYFNPEKVKHPEDLPYYWKMVYNQHNKLEMSDCRYLKYRYIHIPIKIMPRYPRIAAKGIFALCDSEIKLEEITANDLIWIGNEFNDN